MDVQELMILWNRKQARGFALFFKFFSEKRQLIFLSYSHQRLEFINDLSIWTSKDSWKVHWLKISNDYIKSSIEEICDEWDSSTATLKDERFACLFVWALYHINLCR